MNVREPFNEASGMAGMNETGSGIKNAVWNPETGPFFPRSWPCFVLLRFYFVLLRFYFLLLSFY
jgi:hypothetical protein